MNLVARDNKRYFPNVSLWFVDEARDTETYLCDVSNVIMSNTPYAPDEFYSYTASLHRIEDRLYARVVQNMENVLGVSERKIMCFVSVDNGVTWAGIEPPVTLSPANELCSLS